MPDSVFVWAVSDMFGLIVLGITVLGLVGYFGYVTIYDWVSGWKRRRK